MYAPGASKDLRGRPAKACKVWCLVFACPVTRLINCQVVELSDHSGILDGITRLAAEVGFPKYLMIDQDGATMKGLREAKVNLRNLQHKIYSEHGVVFTTCPVGGHNAHGHVERVIKSVQELLEDCGVKTKRLHATGLQTFLKLVENNYNSLPIGYSYDKSLSNTPLLKIITPNFFKLGRNNDRALEGPIELPHHGAELLDKVNETYKGMFKLWADVYVPKLIYQPKWYKDDKDLKEGDLVYMQKESDNPLGSQWIIGIVEQIIPSRDGKIRRVIVKYQNATENFARFTDRSVRKLVKIFDIEEYVLQDDLTELLKRLDNDKASVGDNGGGDRTADQVTSSNLDRDCFSFIDPTFVSGTWLLPPVPTLHEEQLGMGVEVDVHVVDADHGGDLVGDRGQVPGEENPSVSDPACRMSPEEFQLYPSVSPPSQSMQSPHLSAILVCAAKKTNPSAMDNFVSSSIMEHFALAESCDYSTSQCQDPCESLGLPQLLCCTNLNLE